MAQQLFWGSLIVEGSRTANYIFSITFHCLLISNSRELVLVWPGGVHVALEFNSVQLNAINFNSIRFGSIELNGIG